MDTTDRFSFAWHGTVQGHTEFKTDAVGPELEPSVLRH